MRTPIKNGVLQSDIDFAGFTALNFPLPQQRKFDVKTYGATGDGSTNDTTAIQDTLADIPSTGGVLYFPAGQYKYSGSTLVLDRPITVEGDGGIVNFVVGGFGANGGLAISTIDFNSGTLPLFEVTAHGCSFKNLGLRNTVATPSNGAGILVSANGDRTRYENITVDGFYIDIDVRAGSAHTFNGSLIMGSVLYGIKLRNILVPDGGDHFINDCYIGGHESRAATSAIRIESGGGTKIVNTKINTFLVANLWQNGIDLAVADDVVTSDLLVSNCSIEGYSGTGIKGTTSATNSKYGNIILTGNQFLAFGGTPYGINFSATTANDFWGIVINGNYGRVGSSSNPFIRLANCTDVILSANGQATFSALATFGAGVAFARSQVIPNGGTTGQSLKKLSNDDYDVGWA